MNNQFNELTKNLVQHVTRRAALKSFGIALAGMALAGLLALPSRTSAATLGPLIELSRPNAVGACDDGISGPGPGTINDAAESFVAVNPVNPKNLVAAWIQGPFQNIISATSLDGGKTWQQVPMPLTICSGGPFLGAGDPWLSFAPNGDLYSITVTGNSFNNPSVAVNKSTDGGLHWSAPTILYAPNGFSTAGDKPSLTADPMDSHYVYAVWVVFAKADGNANAGGVADQTFFSRTTDGGQTWEPARAISSPGPTTGDIDHRILVLPNGTLVCPFQEQRFNKTTGVVDTSLALIRSEDRGQSWSGPSPIADELKPTAFTAEPWFQTVDPENGRFVSSDNHQFTVDPKSGRLYAVWEDTRFSNFQTKDIAFVMSEDGGLSWSTPIRVNQTPASLPAGNRQAFIPSIAVALDGTIGVTYYDFRFNDTQPGLPTDYWLVQCHPSRRVSPADPANWSDELRLTSKSFDVEKAWAPFLDYFMGDYEGLATIGNDFVSTFNQVDRDNVTSVFFRRIQR